MKKQGVISKDELFKIIVADLNKMPTDKSSKILFDLYILPDFKLWLTSSHRIVATLIEAYQLYDPEMLSCQVTNGSTIIGKLLRGKNELIAAKYLRELLQEKQRLAGLRILCVNGN